jgi:hypothetical protein
MDDRKSGKGLLEKAELPDATWNVNYDLLFIPQTIKDTVAGIPALEKTDVTVTIVSLDGETIPEGEYNLYLEDEEFVRLHHGNDGWRYRPT